MSVSESMVRTAEQETNIEKNYTRILEIFPDFSPIFLRLIFNKCDNNFVRAIDNILYIKRSCCYLNDLRKRKESETKRQNTEENLSQVNNNVNQANFATTTCSPIQDSQQTLPSTNTRSTSTEPINYSQDTQSQFCDSSNDGIYGIDPESMSFVYSGPFIEISGVNFFESCDQNMQ